MAEQAVDTQVTPPEPTGQATEPTKQAAPQDGGNGDQATGDQQVPPQLTPEQREQQLEERMFQKVASWQGRRDKALMESIGQMMSALKQSPQAQAPAQPMTVDATTLLEKPESVISQVFESQAPKVFEKFLSQRTQAEQQFTNTVVRSAAAIMDADPLFADQAFGNEVVAEIQKNFGNMRRDINPEVAAQLLVNSAVTNVYRRTKSPSNGLSGNRPATVPLGGVKPPPSTPPKAPPVKLSPEAQKLAERFGYKSEDLAKVFAEA